MDKKKELGLQITRNEKRYAACEEVANLIDVALGALRVAKKHQGDVFELDVASSELSGNMLTVIADLMSMREEYLDIASDIADETKKAKQEREE